MEEGPVKIEADEVVDASYPWKFCLVGYFGGHFPGKVALKQIVEAWKGHVSTHFHNSGWIIFKFDNEESQMQVMQGGPYIVFGRPLLLKVMSQFFIFENEELSKFPVWVQLRNLPLALWGSRALSKICSILGSPMYTDKVTAHRERVSYARALVEIDVTKEVKHSIELVLPNGNKLEQSIFYENLPRFCSHCKVIGHSMDGCKVKERADEKLKKAVATRVRSNKGAMTVGADATIVPLVDKENGATNVQRSTDVGPSSTPAVTKEVGSQLVPKDIVAADAHVQGPTVAGQSKGQSNNNVAVAKEGLQVQESATVGVAAMANTTAVAKGKGKSKVHLNLPNAQGEAATTLDKKKGGNQNQKMVQPEPVNQMPIVLTSQMRNKGKDTAEASLRGQINIEVVQPHSAE